MIVATRNDANQTRSEFPPAQSWPFLRTPLSVFLMVMLPINGLQVFLFITNTPVWIKITAAIVVLWTLLALVQGYCRRLIVDRRGVRLRGLFRSIEIPWNAVARMDVYIPGGGLGATGYLFATTKQEEPQGKWDIDDETIQVQDRPGLLDAVRACQSARVM